MECRCAAVVFGQNAAGFLLAAALCGVVARSLFAAAFLALGLGGLVVRRVFVGVSFAANDDFVFSRLGTLGQHGTGGCVDFVCCRCELAFGRKTRPKLEAKNGNADVLNFCLPEKCV